MELGWCNVPANLETASGAAGATGNSSELGAELSALPVKSVTGSNFTAGAAWPVPAPVCPSRVTTLRAQGKAQLIPKGEMERGEFSTSAWGPPAAAGGAHPIIRRSGIFPG